MNQKSIDLYQLNPKKIIYKNAQEIEDRGFFIGLHTTPLSKESVQILVKNLLLIDKIKWLIVELQVPVEYWVKS